jgi:hypothetical protein
MKKNELERVEGIIGRYGGAKECEIWVTAVEPDGDWEAPGYHSKWNPYEIVSKYYET